MASVLGSSDSNFSMKTNYDQPIAKAGEEEGFFKCCRCISGSLGLALLIIGSVGTAGYLSGAWMGGLAIGLSIPMALASCCGGAENDQGVKRGARILLDAIYAIAMTVLGSLAIAGVIPPTIMGFCMIAPTFVLIALCCCLNYVKRIQDEINY